MTADELLKLIWKSEDLLAYYEQVASMPIGEFLNWYKLTPVKDIFKVIDLVLYSHEPKELAHVTGLSVETIYSLSKRCNRNKKPSLTTTIKLIACGITII